MLVIERWWLRIASILLGLLPSLVESELKKMRIKMILESLDLYKRSEPGQWVFLSTFVP